MRVFLFDVDSVIPNLPLTKISAYHKARGDEVSFAAKHPDIIYASVVFRANLHKTDSLRFLYPEAEIHIGGTGHDLVTRLPEEIDRCKPDYELYPEQSYSHGHATRGCIRNCHFCWVPEKEGKIHRWQHPREFHDDRFKAIRLFDNNWLADRKWFFETSQWIIDNDLELIEGGLDLRLLNDEIAEQLSNLRCSVLHFAWDYDKDEKKIVEGIQILQKHGINTKNNCRFYVYVDSDAEYDSAVRRCRILKKNHCTPQAMFNLENKRTARIKRLQRWSGKPHILWCCDIDEYDGAIRGHIGMEAIAVPSSPPPPPYYPIQHQSPRRSCPMANKEFLLSCHEAN